MTDFNTCISINEIKQAYATSIFPNAMCLLWNKEEWEELLITNFSEITETENSEGVGTDGRSRFHI